MNSLYVILFLNEFELICLHTGIGIVSVQLNGFNYCDLTLIFLFNINHLFKHRQIRGYKYCYLTLIILLNIIHSFAHS